jgi:hypothetical protein
MIHLCYIKPPVKKGNNLFYLTKPGTFVDLARHTPPPPGAKAGYMSQRECTPAAPAPARSTPATTRTKKINHIITISNSYSHI